MEEVENEKSLNTQEAPAETESHVEPKQEVPVSKVSQEEKQAYKWNEMRRKERELQETIRMQQELLEKFRATPQAPAQVDEIDSIGADEYIPKGKVDKIVEKKAQRIAKEEVEKILLEREKLNFHSRLQSKYADFDEVVNPDTLALLEEKDPELAMSIAESKDPYKIGVQSYKYIKALKLQQEAPEARHQKEAEKKLEANKNTVQSPQAYDKRPMAAAFRMTEEQKSQLYDEMMQFARMA